MPDWEREDVKRWKEEAIKQQNDLYDVYGDRIWWNGDPKTDGVQLQAKLAGVIFGPPPKLGEANLSNFGYTSKELKLTKQLSSKIIKYFQGNTSIAVVFVSAKTKYQSIAKSVFRVWNRNKQVYIDLACRIYGDWSCFIHENHISACYLCYPMNGNYELDMISGNIVLDFGTSPEFNTKRKVIKIFDIVSNLASLSGLLVLVVAEFVHEVDDLSVEWSIFFALVILYNLFKFIYIAYDVYKHW